MERVALRLPADQQADADLAQEQRVVRWIHMKTAPWPKGVLFGDSLATCREARVVKSIEKLVGKQGLVFLLDASFAGMHPLQFYTLLPDVLTGNPSLVIVEINLPLLSGATHRSQAGGYQPLARKQPLASIPALWAAMTQEGIGPLDPLVYRLLDALDALHVADGVRESGRQALERWGTTLGATLHLPTARFLGLPAFDATLARELFGIDQTRSPTVAVLRAITDTVRAAGVPVLLYVAPVDVGTLDALGVRQELRLPARVEALRQAVGAEPSEWLDLHALLPGSAFRDPWGHLVETGCDAVAAQLVGPMVAPRPR